jgi:hypothetical protein
MTLEYWREYRTYFHIGQSWRVNESTAYRIIRKIEDTLTKSRTFTLPGKKRLTNSDYQLQVVIVDVTESPIERPKKTKKVLQWEKETAYIEVPGSGRPSEWSNHLHRSWER